MKWFEIICFDASFHGMTSNMDLIRRLVLGICTSSDANRPTSHPIVGNVGLFRIPKPIVGHILCSEFRYQLRLNLRRKLQATCSYIQPNIIVFSALSNSVELFFFFLFPKTIQFVPSSFSEGVNFPNMTTHNIVVFGGDHCGPEVRERKLPLLSSLSLAVFSRVGSH